MTEKPILFSAPMVRAILNGTKTQTRRVIKPQPTGSYIGEYVMGHSLMGAHGKPITSPYGLAGDQLWVKETWRTEAKYDAFKPTKLPDDAMINCKAGFNGLENSNFNILANKWRSSLFMQKRFSRIHLEIINVRVERLNDISANDAIAEGVEVGDFSDIEHDIANGISVVDRYKDLWESINGAGSWSKNPFVWVIEFERVNHG